jgi:hypothetical protein
MKHQCMRHWARRYFMYTGSTEIRTRRKAGSRTEIVLGKVRTGYYALMGEDSSSSCVLSRCHLVEFTAVRLQH